MTASAQLSLDDLLLRPETITVKQLIEDPKAYGLRVDDIRYLTGPIVEHPGGWGVGVLRKLIPPARLKLILSGEKNLCTLEEALGYLSTFSLGGPPMHDYAQVMFWLTQEIFEKTGMMEDVAGSVLGLSSPVELSDYQRNHILNRLRRDIRNSVVKNAKAKARALR